MQTGMSDKVETKRAMGTVVSFEGGTLESGVYGTYLALRTDEGIEKVGFPGCGPSIRDGLLHHPVAYKRVHTFEETGLGFICKDEYELTVLGGPRKGEKFEETIWL